MLAVSNVKVGDKSHFGRISDYGHFGRMHEVARFMTTQVGLGVEALGAEGAVEGSLARVAAYVPLKVALLVEALEAQMALMWLFACVSLHVPCKVHLLVEAPAAHGAPKRALRVPANHHARRLAPGKLSVDPVSVLIHMACFMKGQVMLGRAHEVAILTQPGSNLCFMRWS